MLLDNTLPLGFSARAATIDDVEKITELVRLCENKLYRKAETTSEDVHHDFNMPGFDIATDSWLVHAQDGLLVGMAAIDQMEHARLWLDFAVHPQYQDQGIGEYLLHEAEMWGQRQVSLAAPELRVVISVGEDVLDQASQQLLLGQGYQVVRRTWRMEIELQEPPIAPQWPAGIHVRTVAPGMERAVYEVDEEAFKDHWGHTPHTFDEWSYWTTQYKDYDPSLWFLAMDGDEIAGIALCGIEKEVGAWVHVLCVRRLWRRKGIAMALLQHSFAEFYKRGQRAAYLTVDSQNLTGATRLYERAGMYVIRQRDRYEKELRAGEELSKRTLTE
ncbi:MAG TPA: GNAT family N-acetyltransferase [Ktedonobacteraceae bacterium]|jgi:mycothiol synthase